MLGRLFLLFTLIPLVEVLLLVWVAKQTSLGFTITLVLVTGVAGAVLARWQGWQAMQRVRQALAKGELPTQALADGVLILIAGVLLIAPGVLTDVAGILLLLPPVRAAFWHWLSGRWRSSMDFRSFSPLGEMHTNSRQANPAGPARIIDVQVVQPEKANKD